jgi:hypothetical protein
MLHRVRNLKDDTMLIYIGDLYDFVNIIERKGYEWEILKE